MKTFTAVMSRAFRVHVTALQEAERAWCPPRRTSEAEWGAQVASQGPPSGAGTCTRKALIATGFTLIELLIVIGIIAILSAVAFVLFRNAQADARDAKRINDVSQVANGLRFYYNEFGKFPVNPLAGVTCYYDSAFALSGNSFYSASCLKELMDSGIVPQLPDAPHTGPAAVTNNIQYTYGYYGYAAPSQNPGSPGAVVGTILETRTEPSSCQFATGGWCDQAAHENRYCVCLYY